MQVSLRDNLPPPAFPSFLYPLHNYFAVSLVTPFRLQAMLAAFLLPFLFCPSPSLLPLFLRQGCHRHLPAACFFFSFFPFSWFTSLLLSRQLQDQVFAFCLSPTHFSSHSQHSPIPPRLLLHHRLILLISAGQGMAWGDAFSRCPHTGPCLPGQWLKPLQPSLDATGLSRNLLPISSLCLHPDSSPSHRMGVGVGGRWKLAALLALPPPCSMLGTTERTDG